MNDKNPSAKKNVQQQTGEPDQASAPSKNSQEPLAAGVDNQTPKSATTQSGTAQSATTQSAVDAKVLNNNTAPKPHQDTATSASTAQAHEPQSKNLGSTHAPTVDQHYKADNQSQVQEKSLGTGAQLSLVLGPLLGALALGLVVFMVLDRGQQAQDTRLLMSETRERLAQLNNDIGRINSDVQRTTSDSTQAVTLAKALEQTTKTRLDTLEQTAAQRIDSINQTTLNRFDTLDKSTSERIETIRQATLDRYEQRFGRLDDSLKRAQQQMDLLGDKDSSNQQQVFDALENIQNQFKQLKGEIRALSGDNRDDWLLEEAEYLLRIANQRLALAGDTVGVALVLTQVDQLLASAEDFAIVNVRNQLTQDITRINDTKQPDINGLYLKLDSFYQQALNVLNDYQVELPEKPVALSGATAVAQNDAPTTGEYSFDALQQTMSEFWQSLSFTRVKESLDQYIAIRSKEQPIEPLLTNQQRGLINQNIRLLVSQAQLALLRGDDSTYRLSFEQIKNWLSTFISANKASNQQQFQQLQQTLEDLAQAEINPVLPDISASLKALQRYRNNRQEAVNLPLISNPDAQARDSQAQDEPLGADDFNANTVPQG